MIGIRFFVAATNSRRAGRIGPAVRGSRPVTRRRTMAAVALAWTLAGSLFLPGCSRPTAPSSEDSPAQAPSPTAQTEATPDATPTPTDTPSRTPADCTDVVVLAVRGTGEPLGGGLLAPLVERIDQRYDGTLRGVDIDYPATWDWSASPDEGVRLVVQTLDDLARDCPSTRTVLLGYSQGALVVGDALVAPENRLMGCDSDALDQAAADQVAAIVLYGDPRFVGGEPFDAGTYDPDVDGMLARAEGDLDAYAPRIRSFCNAGDFVCQNGGGDDAAHGAYATNGSVEEGTGFALEELG